jgi:hypothetical protein
MDKSKSNSTELLLCGSGLPAFAHIGVLRALEEKGVKASTIAGGSTSALIAALYANGASSSVIQDLFLNRAPQRFNAADWLGVQDGCQATPRMFCPVVDLVPIAEKFVRENGLKAVPGLRIVCYDLLSKQPVVFSGSNYDLALALAAACAVPGISRPVRTGEYLLVDISAHEWEPERHCGKQAIISRTAYENDENGLTQLDRWLNQRRQLLRVVECKAGLCCQSERLVITTKLTAQDGCGCDRNDAARSAVIAAGHRAARAQLETA